MYKGYSSSSPDNLPEASLLSKQVLCLPIYPTLSEESQNEIIHVILTAGHVRAA
jgi:dTDP-4-amino-4,6-dideoxygalactose transaminase